MCIRDRLKHAQVITVEIGANDVLVPIMYGIASAMGLSLIHILRYQLLYPTLILSFVTIAFYLISNAFSDAADPKNHLQ